MTTPPQPPPNEWWWDEVHNAAAAIWGYANDDFQIGDEEEVKRLAEKILAIAEEQGASPSWKRR